MNEYSCWVEVHSACFGGKCLPLYNFIADDSVIALANGCPHLRSLGLYYCRNITDRAIYSLAQSGVKNKPGIWESMKGRYDEEGLQSLNISQCTALTPPAVQALCDTFPALHTCSGRHSLVMSGCLNLTSVHCVCAGQSHRTASSIPHPAHWIVQTSSWFVWEPRGMSVLDCTYGCVKS